LILEGPAGIGKTRLLQESRWRAQLRGLDVVEVRFFENSGEPSLLSALKARRRGHGGASAWLESMAAVHGGSTAERARRAAEGYFESAGPPLVLLLDDLELADRDSRLLVEAFMTECLRRSGSELPGKGLALLGSRAGGIGRGVISKTRGGRFVKRLKPLPVTRARTLLFKLTRPLKVSERVLGRLARQARGCPLDLRNIARSLLGEWGQAGVVPETIEAPSPKLERESPRTNRLRIVPEPRRGSPELRVLQALTVLKRPSHLDEIAAAAGLQRSVVRRVLSRLLKEETIAPYPRGRTRCYSLRYPEAARRLLETMSSREVRDIHWRMVTFLRADSPDPARLESLCRHLLAVGKREEARRLVEETAAVLRSRGLLESAVRLLSDAASMEAEPLRRLRLVEAMSSLHQEAGDHEEGIAVLDPIYRDWPGNCRQKDALRIRRRLGVHCHRAGVIDRALKLFKEVQELADPATEVEELILVESELAELHTLQGRYGEAERACRKGLELLEKHKEIERDFRGRMEVMLHASMGHLELRRMALERAGMELETAANLARSFATTATQALILNNLGIVYNQQNQFTRAKRCYVMAKGLSLRAGERREIILIASNLATIAAKQGDANAVREHLAQAKELLARYPGKRLEFLATMASGVAAHFLGDFTSAVADFQRALPLGRELGDEQSLVYATVYLAEAHLASGQYGQAARRLGAAFTPRSHSVPPVFRRMVQSRVFFLETLLGRERAASDCLRELECTPRTQGLLIESWNDLFVASGLCAGGHGEKGEALFRDACSTFRRLGIPSGHRFARIGLLEAALKRSDTQEARLSVQGIEQESGECHRFLSVLEPLERAEAYLSFGDGVAAESCLREATGAIVGLKFLELDWRIELLRARLAERQGDREAARLYVHRSLHTRSLLASSLPARLRARFLRHPRFASLEHLVERLEKPRPTPTLKAGTGAASRRHGILGRSAEILKVFEAIDRIRDQEIPVLITGETGTGKDLVAKAIHEMGPRQRGPFHVLHCAALPPELFESELFGHEAGAFTGAEESRAGLLEFMAGGTLLLDEVSSLPLDTQAKLLRVLDTHVVRPLGSLETRAVDVRFLATSSKDLLAMMTAGAFRADLYYRIARLEIRLPPLRARREDLSELAPHFLTLHARRLGRTVPRLSVEALDLLASHEWPGNVRELETTLLRLLVSSAPGGSIDAENLRPFMPRTAAPVLFDEESVAGRDLRQLRDELERVYLRRLFRDTKGDVSRMTRILGVKHASLYRWFKRLGLNVRSMRREG
jgi:DNA-binding NtrC family response regulator/tetratricopeptide (TPR) repeat protein